MSSLEFLERRWAALCSEYSHAVDFITLGVQPPRILSQVFQLLDLGLPSASWRLLAKSSAAASMLDHGLPLVVLPDPHSGFEGEAVTAGDPRLIVRCDGGLEAKLIAGLEKKPPGNSVVRVAGNFLGSLRAAAGMDKK